MYVLYTAIEPATAGLQVQSTIHSTTRANYKKWISVHTKKKKREKQCFKFLRGIEKKNTAQGEYVDVAGLNPV